MKIGNRIRISKSDPDQSQFVNAGERGTILNMIVDDDKHIILEIKFDDGQTLLMDNTTFRFETYRGKNENN